MARKADHHEKRQAANKTNTDNGDELNESHRSEVESPPAVSLNQLFEAASGALSEGSSDELKNDFKDLIMRHLRESLAGDASLIKHNFLIHFDEGQLVPSDADKVYSAVRGFKEKKPLLMLLYSTGGVVNPAYLIGKVCRKYSNDKFIVVVPRLAKSAATLICCAADEIHMGDLSELGPIDPQIKNFPALGLKNAVEHLAGLTEKYPGAAPMIADYLSRTMKNPIDLGYYERVAESAVQYGVRLLKLHQDNLGGRDPESIANKLVYEYKDHGFVIDSEEAAGVFGSGMIKIGSPIYDFGSRAYSLLTRVQFLCDLFNHNFYLIGSLDSKPEIYERRNG